MSIEVGNGSPQIVGSGVSTREWRASLPMSAALVAVAVVWLLGCVWSFEEQTAFAHAKQFVLPQLLPLVIDGFAIAMAWVAWAASLDGRAAVAARLAMFVAVAASSASNGTWAFLRSDGDLATIAVAVAVPIAANMAFEVLLGELRRQVQRRRGLPAPAVVPNPRLIRVALAPVRTFVEWRSLVLRVTDPAHSLAEARPQGGGLAEASPRTAPAPAAAPIPASQTGNSEADDDRRGSGTEADSTRPGAGVPAARVSPPRRPLRAAPRPQGSAPPARSLMPAAPSDQVDPQVLALAAALAEHDEPDDVTCYMVSNLLGMEVAPRAGRRLLGQARQLLRAA